MGSGDMACRFASRPSSAALNCWYLEIQQAIVFQHMHSHLHDTYADTCIPWQAKRDVINDSKSLQTWQRRLLPPGQGGEEHMSLLAPSSYISHGRQQAQSCPPVLQGPQMFERSAPLGVAVDRLHAAARLGQPADDGVQRHAVVPVRVDNVVVRQAAALVAQRARDARCYKVDGPAIGCADIFTGCG